MRASAATTKPRAIKGSSIIHAAQRENGGLREHGRRRHVCCRVNNPATPPTRTTVLIDFQFHSSLFRVAVPYGQLAPTSGAKSAPLPTHHVRIHGRAQLLRGGAVGRCAPPAQLHVVQKLHGHACTVKARAPAGKNLLPGTRCRRLSFRTMRPVFSLFKLLCGMRRRRHGEPSAGKFHTKRRNLPQRHCEGIDIARCRRCRAALP